MEHSADVARLQLLIGGYIFRLLEFPANPVTLSALQPMILRVGALGPFLTGRMFVRRTYFGQFDEIYFVLNWLVMRCKLRPELAADAQQTA